MKILKEIKNSPFKPLTKKWYFGKIVYGAPYMYPMGFVKSILSFRILKLTPQEELDKLSNPWQKEAKKYKNLPMVRRSWNKIFHVFGVPCWIALGTPISYSEVDLGWKDKFNTPRLEWGPRKCFYFFKWQICVFYQTPKTSRNEDNYWEMYLWWKYYSNEDLTKAKETWGWIDGNTKESTWDPSNLKNC